MRLHLKIENPNVETFYRQVLHNHGNFMAHPDAGFDLFCPKNMTVEPGQTVWVDLGIACEAFRNTQPAGVQPTGFYIYPRSSISKTPLRLANSIGIIDSGYRGNLILALDNIKDFPYTIQKGQRLAQICSPLLDSIWFDIVETLSETDRGAGGFGSTGT